MPSYDLSLWTPFVARFVERQEKDVPNFRAPSKFLEGRSMVEPPGELWSGQFHPEKEKLLPSQISGDVEVE